MVALLQQQSTPVEASVSSLEAAVADDVVVMDRNRGNGRIAAMACVAFVESVQLDTGE